MTSSLFSRFGRAGLVAGVMALTVGTSCAQDQEFLLVENAVWFDPSDRTGCELTETSPIPILMTVDVGFDTRIGMGFVVTNQAADISEQSGIDDNEIKIETAEVTLSFTGGGVSPASFDVPVATNSIPSGETGVVVFSLPFTVTESLRSTMAGLPAGNVEVLELEVVFKGRRKGQIAGTKLGVVESRPFSFPFDVCLGCLSSCLPDSECGGDAGALVCADSPVQGEWIGVCGFAQGVAIYAAGCTPP